MVRRILEGGAIFVTVIGLILSGPAPTEAQEPALLEAGRPMEGELKRGEERRYRLPLAAGQYVRVELRHPLGDCSLTLSGENGQPVVSVDLMPGPIQPEVLTAIIETSGEYRIAVKSTASLSRYRLELTEARTAGDADRQAVEADRLHRESQALRGAGKFEDARQRIESARGIYESLRGPDHPDLIRVLREEAGVHLLRRDFDRAEAAYKRQVEISEKAFGAADPRTADALEPWGIFHTSNKVDFARAEEIFKRMLRIYEAAYPADHPAVANGLMILGALYQNRVQYGDAERLYRRALAIQEKSPDPEATLSPLQNIASLLATSGNYAEADVYFARVQSAVEGGLADGGLLRGFLYFNRGKLSLDIGNPDRAESFLDQAEEFFTKRMGAENRFSAAVLAQRMRLHRERGEWEKAEAIQRQTLAVRRKTLPAGHPDIGRAAGALAEILLMRDRGEEALPFFEEALHIYEKAFGPEFWGNAALQVTMGRYRRDRGEYAEAERLARLALPSYEKGLGRTHPYYAEALDLLVSIYRATGRLREALEAREQTLEINEEILRRNLFSGSDAENVNYLAKYAPETHETLSLQTMEAAKDPRALRMALTTVLRRKGRAFDTASQTYQAMRERGSEEDRALLEQLRTQAAKLSRLLSQGSQPRGEAAFQAEARRLHEETERLASQVGLRYVEFRAQAQAATIENVQAALPPGAALIEIFLLAPSEAKTRAELPPVYVAYGLRHDGGVFWARLGERSAIDPLLRRWREALSNPASRAEPALARRVERAALGKLWEHLNGITHLIVSPDGAFNFVPFAALENAAGERLAGRMLVSYVTSGRDLPRFGARRTTRSPAAIFAGADFDDATGGPDTAAAADGTRAAAAEKNLASLSAFASLANTLGEGRSIQAMLPGAQTFFGAQATEAAFKGVRGPWALHLATHGFFLPDASDGHLAKDARSAARRPRAWENPLLRSGLAMAGANARKSGAEDGLLTALEVSRVDLSGTRLVVLSACVTGLGAVENGQGVQGLRRALVLAGAEAQVTSLWQVADEVTKELMIKYYRLLLPAHGTGAGRAEAMRRVQLDLLANRARRHPYYWASFLPIGDWRPIEKDR